MNDLELTERLHGAGLLKCGDNSYVTIDGDVFHIKRAVTSSTARRYLQVGLRVNGKPVLRAVDTLVLRTFVGPPPNGQEARHLNGDSHDNRLTNLQWGTAVENAADKALHGTVVRGSRNPNAKLDLARIDDAGRRRAAGEPWAGIARDLGVSPTTVMRAVTGRTWQP